MRSDCEDARGDTVGSNGTANAKDVRLLDGPASGVCTGVIVAKTGRADGGGARSGITGDGGDGVGGLTAGADDSDVVVPLRPANIAGMGEAMAIWNEGGGAK